ncbi:hypothetical protein DPMN_168763 [Dreissena polymorpha]|uniref:Uncharacterized protein n=1 Tax=Dreissena polymorpha TaxID=45954 RepID=A0A9D4F3A3_DREPO|nr:hypothetical protein DPMN_168763 [Dreissena polymorpha]
MVDNASMTNLLWTLTLSLGLISCQPIVRQNVIFVPVITFSTTHATWTKRFVKDLLPYDNFLDTVQHDLTTTETLSRTLTNKYLPTNSYKFVNLYLSAIQGLSVELQHL